MEVVSRFAAGVAHDLNNILLVVQGYAEMALAEEPDAGPAARAHLAEVRDAAVRAPRSSCVTSSSSASAAPFSPRAPRPRSRSSRAASVREGRRAPDGVEIRSSLADGPAAASSRTRNRSARSLAALVRARAGSHARGGRITISTAAGGPDPAGSSVVLRVHDTGAPRAEELRPRLFEPYLPGTGRGGKGLGLGMSVAYARRESARRATSRREAAGGRAIEVRHSPVGAVP